MFCKVVVYLDDFDFGKTDGKFEAEKDNFLSLFYNDNIHYNKLTSENCFIVSGFKGTGKTILASYFLKRKKVEANAHIRNLNSTDFIQEKLLSFSESPITKEELVVFWKYVYLRELGYLVKKRAEKSVFFRLMNRRKIRILSNILDEAQLIIDSSEEIAQDVLRKKSDLKTSASISESLGLNLNASRLHEQELLNSSKFKKIRAKYTEIIRKLEDLLLSLIKPNHEYYIVYDDMDQLDETVERASFIQLIKQMLYAADALNRDFREHELKCRVIHVVRSDVLSLVINDSYNLFKTVTDFGTEIDWYTDRQKNPETHPLMKMIIHKAKSSVSEYEEIDDKLVYNSIFNREENILDYVLQHSLGRPRELVKFLSIVQDNYPKETKITLEMLSDCLPQYSRWFYDSLMSEIKLSSHIDDIVKVFNIIQTRGVKTLTVTKLLNFASIKSLPIPENIISTLSQMYTMGILGIRNSNGLIQFYHRSNVPTTPTDSTKFIVHFGLLKYLNIKN